MFLLGLEQQPCLCHVPPMAKRTPMAGGFLLMAAILIGAVWGVAGGNPMKGILIGTGVGIGVALLIWLLDSRRRS
jgi:hypothetical protein